MYRQRNHVNRDVYFSQLKNSYYVTRREYAYNSFSRSFSLPENVNPDGITAEYADGVLKVKMPKKNVEEKIAKQILVK